MSTTQNPPRLRLVRPPEEHAEPRGARTPATPAPVRPTPLPMGVIEAEARRRQTQAYGPPPVRRGGAAVASNPVASRAIAPPATPISDPLDPRWMLAVRTTHQLEGSILTPEKRELLIREGVDSGLTPFDANLVIAIVQEQARRGVPAVWCAIAGEEQLRMIAPPREPDTDRKARWMLRASWIALAVLAAEAAMLAWCLR